MFLTMGKSFIVGYKVAAASYDASYSWNIVPRVKDSLNKVTITLKAEVEYKSGVKKSIQKLLSETIFVPRYKRALESLVGYVDVSLNFRLFID